jgi:hypothetical protein
MIELAAACEAGKAGLGLVAELITLAEELRKYSKGDPSLSELLARLRLRAGELAREAQDSIVQLKNDIGNSDIDESRTINDLLRETKWYQWVIRSRLRDARDRFLAIEDQLRGLIDDVSTLLMCSGRVYDTGGAFADARREKVALMSSISTEIPIKDLLAKLSDLSTRLDSAK